MNNNKEELTPGEREQRREEKRRRLAAMPGNAPEYDFSAVLPMEDSPLRGRRLCLLGSSVAYGSGSLEQAVGEYLAARMGFTFRKETVSGTTIADNGETSYVSRMKALIDPKERFDLFICQLGTNDAKRGLPLGEISPLAYGAESFDTGTVTGALEYIVSYVRAVWQCPIVFFTGSYFEEDGFGERYAAMVRRLSALSEKWSFPVLDLWNGSEFNAISGSDRALWMKDNVHPTRAGYRDWWGPELERQLLASGVLPQPGK